MAPAAPVPQQAPQAPVAAAAEGGEIPKTLFVADPDAAAAAMATGAQPSPPAAPEAAGMAQTMLAEPEAAPPPGGAPPQPEAAAPAAPTGGVPAPGHPDFAAMGTPPPAGGPGAQPGYSGEATPAPAPGAFAAQGTPAGGYPPPGTPAGGYPPPGTPPPPAGGGYAPQGAPPAYPPGGAVAPAAAPPKKKGACGILALVGGIIGGVVLLVVIVSGVLVCVALRGSRGGELTLGQAEEGVITSSTPEQGGAPSIDYDYEVDTAGWHQIELVGEAPWGDFAPVIVVLSDGTEIGRAGAAANNPLNAMETRAVLTTLLQPGEHTVRVSSAAPLEDRIDFRLTVTRPAMPMMTVCGRLSACCQSLGRVPELLAICDGVPFLQTQPTGEQSCQQQLPMVQNTVRTRGWQLPPQCQ